jgi:urease accessory protein
MIKIKNNRMKSTLHIQTATRNGNSFLKTSFCTPPFKIADITEDKTGPELHVMLMSSSPGILDGDDYALKIELAERSSLHLETQSYQRLFHMCNGASQSLEVHIGTDAFFCFLPHPSVPHAAADFKTKNKFYLSERSGLLWGEVLTCGRKLNGERFHFSSYHSLTEIFKQNRLVVKENLWMTPAITDPCRIGQLEGYTHQASLIFIKDDIDIPETIQQLHCFLEQEEDLLSGCTQLPVNGLLVRLLGNRAEQLYNCFKKIGSHLKKASLQPMVYAE